MIDGVNNLSDSAARKAAERAKAMTFSARTRQFFRDAGTNIVKACSGIWNNTPSAVRSLFLFVGAAVALGFLSVMTWWELGNAGQGYGLIFASWGSLAVAGGVSIAGFAVWAHRQHKENSRAIEDLDIERRNALIAQNLPMVADIERKVKKAKQLRGNWQRATILCSAVTLFGVFSNLVSHASMDTKHAIEVNDDRDELRKTRSRLLRELGTMPKPEGVEFTRETLNGYLAEAAGWGMPNLDAIAPVDAKEGYPGPACVANLPKKRPRDLCNLAVDIRAELKEASEMQAGIDAKKSEIAAVEKQIDSMKPATGAAHYQAMAKLVMSIPGVPDDWEEGGVAAAIQVWGVLFLAIAGLYVVMIGWDTVGEAAQGRKKKPVAGT